MELFKNNIKKLIVEVKDEYFFCYWVKLENEEAIEITYDPHQEAVLVDDVVVDREELAEWLKANGYDEDKLVGEEINAFTEDFKYVLDFQYYRGNYDNESGRFFLAYDEESYWVEEILEVTDIYDFYKHFYGDSGMSLAYFIFEGDIIGILPDTEELLIYWYKKLGWDVKSRGDDSIEFHRWWAFEDVDSDQLVGVSEECTAVSFVDEDFMSIMHYLQKLVTLTYDAFIEAIESDLIPDLVALPIESSNGPVVVSAIDVLTLSFETEIAEVNERIKTYRLLVEEIAGSDIWDRISKSIDDIHIDFGAFDPEGTITELLVEMLDSLFKEEDQRAVAEKVEKTKQKVGNER